MNETYSPDDYKSFKSDFIQSEKSPRSSKPMILVFLNIVLVFGLVYFALTRQINSQRKKIEGLTCVFRVLKIDNRNVMMSLSLQNKNKDKKRRAVNMSGGRVLFGVRNETGRIFVMEVPVDQNPANETVRRKGGDVYEFSANDLISFSAIYDGDTGGQKLDYFCEITISGKQHLFEFKVKL